MKKLRILIADDHKMVRDGLKLLLDQEPDMQVVGEAGNGREALRKAAELTPDVVLMDLSMPEMNGIQATELLRTQAPKVKVVVLTAHEDELYLQRLCRVRVAGFLLKRSASAEVIQALRKVAAGETYYEPLLVEKALGRSPSALEAPGKASPAPAASLSEREIEVGRLVAFGASNKEIAAELNLSAKTVESYKASINEKLGIHSRAEMVRYALAEGWMRQSLPVL